MTIRAALLTSLILAFSPMSHALAAEVPAANPPAAKTLTASQQRMVDCNKEASAKNLLGTQRREFMRTCMHGDAANLPPATPQNRMRACNQQAAEQGLTMGPQRREFMSQCLKKP